MYTPPLVIDFTNTSHFRRAEIVGYLDVVNQAVERRVRHRWKERFDWVITPIDPDAPLPPGMEACRARLRLTITEHQIETIADMNIITRDPKNPRRRVRSDKAENARPQNLVQYLLEHIRFAVRIRPFSKFS